jgi:hypothetical protein
MSASGQKQTCAVHQPMSALPLKATAKADIPHPHKMLRADHTRHSRDASMNTEPVRPIRCAIYTRISNDQALERDFNSFDAQYDAAQSYIRGQDCAGWELLRCGSDVRFTPGTGIRGNSEKMQGIQTNRHKPSMTSVFVPRSRDGGRPIRTVRLHFGFLIGRD